MDLLVLSIWDIHSSPSALLRTPVLQNLQWRDFLWFFELNLNLSSSKLIDFWTLLPLDVLFWYVITSPIDCKLVEGKRKRHWLRNCQCLSPSPQLAEWPWASLSTSLNFPVPKQWSFCMKGYNLLGHIKQRYCHAKIIYSILFMT